MALCRATVTEMRYATAGLCGLWPRQVGTIVGDLDGQLLVRVAGLVRAEGV